VRREDGRRKMEDRRWKKDDTIIMINGINPVCGILRVLRDKKSSSS